MLRELPLNNEQQIEIESYTSYLGSTHNPMDIYNLYYFQLTHAQGLKK